MSNYTVSRHSGKSVFEWRVYHVWDHNGRARRTQLAKYRTEAEANRCAEYFRNRGVAQ